MSDEHPFAPFVRILGKGKTGSRNLTRIEARQSFRLILEGQVEPVQLGAFLMLLRVKEETSEELAGFVQACRERLPQQCSQLQPLLDWPSYAGKKRQQPWYVLSALLLADNGISVLMHGADGHTPGRLYTGETLRRLGVEPAENIDGAAAQLRRNNFTWLPLRKFCPVLHEIIHLKPLLGLRSPVNSLTRLLNPGTAPYCLQSVFHPAYIDLHLGAHRHLQQAHTLVFKGDSGEVELKPHAVTACKLLRDGAVETLVWPRRMSRRPVDAAALSPDSLRSVWRGVKRDRYGELAVTETAAIALLLLRKAGNIPDAQDLAMQWWLQRDRRAF